MTGEEMERAIEFLLQSQASSGNRLTAYDERLAQTQTQVNELVKQVGALAETQNEFTQIVTTAVQNLTNAQTRTDDRLDKSDERLAQAQTQVTEIVKQVGLLVETQNEFTPIITTAVQNLTGAQTRTDDRLDKLAATVERFISESRNG